MGVLGMCRKNTILLSMTWISPGNSEEKWQIDRCARCLLVWENLNENLNLKSKTAPLKCTSVWFLFPYSNWNARKKKYFHQHNIQKWWLHFQTHLINFWHWTLLVFHWSLSGFRWNTVTSKMYFKSCLFWWWFPEFQIATLHSIPLQKYERSPIHSSTMPHWRQNNSSRFISRYIRTNGLNSRMTRLS